MKVKLRIASARQWKLLFIAPNIVAHYEQTNRSSTCILVLDSLERVVEPLQRCDAVQDSSFTEHNVANLPFRRGRGMLPWTNNQSLARPSFGCRRLLM